jgi:hypothetical protein
MSRTIKNTGNKKKTKTNDYKKMIHYIISQKFTNDDNDNYNNDIKSNLIRIVLNNVLILSKQRKIAQIELPNYDKKLFIDFCKKYNIKYKIFKYISNQGYSFNRLIIYDPKEFDINTINKSFGEHFGHQLGDFYICSTNDWLSNNLNLNHRITIDALLTINLDNNNKHNFTVELYAQMCTKKMIEKNMDLFKKISKNIKNILQRLNMNIDVVINVRKKI